MSSPHLTVTSPYIFPGDSPVPSREEVLPCDLGALSLLMEKRGGVTPQVLPPPPTTRPHGTRYKLHSVSFLSWPDLDVLLMQWTNISNKALPTGCMDPSSLMGSLATRGSGCRDREESQGFSPLLCKLGLQ